MPPAAPIASCKPWSRMCLRVRRVAPRNWEQLMSLMLLATLASISFELWISDPEEMMAMGRKHTPRLWCVFYLGRALAVGPSDWMKGLHLLGADAALQQGKYFVALLLPGCPRLRPRFCLVYHVLALKTVSFHAWNIAARSRLSPAGGVDPAPGLGAGARPHHRGPRAAQTRNCARVGKIPLVLGNANEIANGGVARPRPAVALRSIGSAGAERRRRECHCACGDRSRWRQGRKIHRIIAAGRARPPAPAARDRRPGPFRRWGLGSAAGASAASAGLRPSRDQRAKNGSDSFTAIFPAAPACRARPALTLALEGRARATWCSAMKASSASTMSGGIGTVSIRSLPASANASPSAGSAVTASTS